MELGILLDFDTRNYKKKINIGKNISNKDIQSVNDDDFKKVF